MSFTPTLCRPGCAACCIVVSISETIPGLGGPKPAGMRCPHLTQDNLCDLFGRTERPKVCSSYGASRELCGERNEEAWARHAEWERLTSPD
ncbi:MAG: hypothetical protein RL095_1990 [Verrucomicrobiota bacterium]|jgi:hypothetical protein